LRTSRLKRSSTRDALTPSALASAAGGEACGPKRNPDGRRTDVQRIAAITGAA
jgi:hypothetical protein